MGRDTGSVNGRDSLPGRQRPSPGSDAPAGTPGTGEDICPVCAGSGRSGGGTCPNCDGTGVIVEGIGGG